jgi:hypothetical protein
MIKTVKFSNLWLGESTYSLEMLFSTVYLSWTLDNSVKGKKTLTIRTISLRALYKEL